MPAGRILDFPIRRDSYDSIRDRQEHQSLSIWIQLQSNRWERRRRQLKNTSPQPRPFCRQGAVGSTRSLARSALSPGFFHKKRKNFSSLAAELFRNTIQPPLDHRLLHHGHNFLIRSPSSLSALLRGVHPKAQSEANSLPGGFSKSTPLEPTDGRRSG